MNSSREKIVLRFLTDTLKHPSGAYGYNIWLPNDVTHNDLLWCCAVKVLESEPPPYTPPTTGTRQVMAYHEDIETKVAKEIFPLASDVLWLLSLQGFLRPGVRLSGGQSVPDGQGYSLTLKGWEWVKTCAENDLQELCVLL